MSTFGKVVLAIGLGVVGLAGLAMSLCGGAFTILSFNDPYIPTFIPVIVLVIGIGGLWLSVKGWKKVFASRPAPLDESRVGDPPA
ncbi:hypothetical protein BH09PSE6_BH09PSE6_03050 [soil metagenome]